MTESATPPPDEIAGLIKRLREASTIVADKVIFDQHQRIGELEAETDRLRDSVNAVRAEYLQRYVNATTRIIELKAERDVIRAKTIEALKPFAEAADAAERNLCKHNTDEILIRLGHLRRAREAIRALAQTDEASADSSAP